MAAFNKKIQEALCGRQMISPEKQERLCNALTQFYSGRLPNKLAENVDWMEDIEDAVYYMCRFAQLKGCEPKFAYDNYGYWLATRSLPKKKRKEVDRILANQRITPEMTWTQREEDKGYIKIIDYHGNEQVLS